MSELAGIGKSYRMKLSRVLEQQTGVLTPKAVAEVLGVSAQESGRLLARWNSNGWVYRIKRGVYIAVPLSSTNPEPILEEPYLVADAIYAPGYVGGFSAVKYWDFTEQIIETITYITRKKVRKRDVTYGGVRYRLKTVTKQKMFGLKNIWIGSKKVHISDPTKTIVDLLDDPGLVGGMTIVREIFSEYFESQHYDFNLLLGYIDKIGNRSINKRLGFLLDTCFAVSNDELQILQERMSEGYTAFDPHTPSSRTITKWRLKTSQSWRDLYDRKE